MSRPTAAQTRDRLERVADTATDPVALFADVAAAVRAAMPLDGWCGHTLDPATSMPTGGDSREGYLPELVPRMLEIEYAVGDVNPFDVLLQQPMPSGILHRATRGEPGRSLRYRDVAVPSGFEHELRVVFRHQRRPWGAIVLLRADDAPPFTAAEARLLGSVTTPMAAAIKRSMLMSYVEGGGVPQHAGLLLLDADLQVETATPEATEWLARLDDGRAGLPLSVVAVVQNAADSAGRAIRSRARVRSGGWVTMTAWTLDGGRVAVSLESAAPHDLTALALEAYSLSPREREIVQLVLLGHSTAQIGDRLNLSAYTVQDHLKTVFEKTGVRSRRGLAADLFFRHYLPQIERGAALDADGWFASAD